VRIHTTYTAGTRHYADAGYTGCVCYFYQHDSSSNRSIYAHCKESIDWHPDKSKVSSIALGFGPTNLLSLSHLG